MNRINFFKDSYADNNAPVEGVDIPGRFTLKSVFSIPNILTYIRIMLVPVFVVVYLNAQTLLAHLLSAGIVVFSGITDFADGIIARKCHMITFLGKIIDPIADKLTQVSIAFCLMLRYRLVIVLFAAMALRELSLAVLGILLIKNNCGESIGSRWYGKVATWVIYMVMIALVGLPKVSAGALGLMVYPCTALVLFAMVMYIYVSVTALARARKTGRII